MTTRAKPTAPTPPPALTEAEKALCAMARDLEPLLSPAWTYFRNAEEGRTEVVVEGDRESVPILLLTEETSHADREMIVRGAQMVRALVAAGRLLKWRVEQLKAENRKLRGEPEPSARKISEDCDYWCRRNDFQAWLRDIHGADVSDLERVRNRLRTMLEVTSRAELDTDPAAARRWQNLLESFKRRQR